MNRIVPLLTVLAALFAVWYVAAAWMNAPLQRDLFANADNKTYTTADLITASLNMERPKLPAPHQIAASSTSSSSPPTRPPSAALSITPASRWRKR